MTDVGPDERTHERTVLGEVIETFSLGGLGGWGKTISLRQEGLLLSGTKDKVFP